MNIIILMDNIDIIINDFCKINNGFDKNKIKNLISDLLLDKHFDKQLYKELYNRNFKLLKGEFITRLEKNISLKSINKLTDLKLQSYIQINDMSRKKLDINIANLIDSFDSNNVYIKNIRLIWKNNIDGYISIKQRDYTFIEKDFCGNYIDYLFFIIPRITKLNVNQLLVLLDYSDEHLSSPDESEYNHSINDNISIDHTDNISIDHTDNISIDHTDNISIDPNDNHPNDNISIDPTDNISIDSNLDNHDIKMIQFNLESVQSELQNLKDSILPKINKMESDINILNQVIVNHQKHTKNSFLILEDRFSKIANIINKEIQHSK